MTGGAPGDARPAALRVEHEHEPTNVPPDAPRFSWRVPTDGRDERQTAYRVFVARDRDALDDDPDCWDSGVVEAPTATGVVYHGAPLEADAGYHWKVRVWIDGERRPDSHPVRFETAPDPSDWDAAWITHQPDGGDANGFRTPWRPADAGPEWVQVDLGEPTAIAALELYPTCPFDGPTTPDGATASALYSWDLGEEPPHTRDGPDGFGFPQRYRILASDDADFAESTVIVDRTDDRGANPGSARVRHEVASTARYVRVVADEPYVFDPRRAPQAGGHDIDPDSDVVAAQVDPEKLRTDRRRWQTFALAALAVRDRNGEDLARDAAVTASVCHESETWGAAALVDGRYRSAMAASSPRLRTEFIVGDDVERARVHVAALGYGEVYVNGTRVANRVLDPAWTDFDETVPVRTYDVTDHVRTGENAVGVWLGRGRFAHNFFDWTGFGSPRVLARIVVEYADGSRSVRGTGPSWRAGPSPITHNDVYDGETYDARREESGWAAPGFDGGAWDDAAVVAPPGGDLAPQRVEPRRVTGRRDPVAVRDGEDGSIVDFGRNLTGWVRLTVRGADAGDRVRLRHAETTTTDGELDTRSLRTARATDTYVARGADHETYAPRFTFHGFRYCEVRGYPGELTADAVEASVVHTDLEPTGSFACSNEDLEAVQHAAVRSLRGNAQGLPTDCPQRDERFGWTGDGRITAGAYLSNVDAARFVEKWLRDHADARTPAGCLPDTVPHGPGGLPSDPAWTITQVRLPWLYYEYYGDPGPLCDHYAGMRRYVEYWHSVVVDGLIPRAYSTYGDWLAREHLDDRGVIGQPPQLFSTAAHYEATATFARIAAVLGHERDADTYRDRADAVAAAFTDRFYDAEATVYEPASQAAQALPLFLGLVPDGDAARVADGLAGLVRDAGEQLRTGFLGTRALLFALADHGHADLAYTVASQPDQPGWVFMVEQGATTLWESWTALDHLELDPEDSARAAAASLNHPSFASVSEWFYAVLAGIRPGRDADGTAHLRIRPQPVGDLDHAVGRLRLPEGVVESGWERTAHGVAHDLTVPWNATATATVPCPSDERVDAVGLDGTRLYSRDGGVAASLPTGIRGVDAAADDGAVRLSVGSGTYAFVVETSDP
jgi:alpha-L-rhamnosidase